MIPFVRITLTGWNDVPMAWQGLPVACELYVKKFQLALRNAVRRVIPPPSFKRIHPKSRNLKIAGGARGASNSLFNSIDMSPVAKRGLFTTASVFLTAKHAKYYTFGTGPHVIEARRGSCLTVYAAGQSGTDRFGWFLPKRVNHPGTPGHNWRNRALDRVTPAQRARMWQASVLSASRKVGGTHDVPAPAMT